jgi:hypothetical protein
MKKIIFSIAVFAISLSGFSQISPFTFGPSVGFNQTSLSTDVSSYTQAAQAGLQGGVFARLTLKKLIIQPEAFIGLKRGDIDFTYSPNGSSGQSFDATQELKLTTLDVPVMVGYQLLDIPLFKIRANAGPVASIVLNKDVTISKNDLPNTSVPTEDIIALKDQAAYSFQTGLGVDVWKLTLDARYNFGISYIDESKSVRNNMFTINLGFKIL